MLSAFLLIAAAFAPVDVPETGTDKAALVDTERVVAATLTTDFEVDGDLSKEVWRTAEPCADFAVRRGRVLPTDVRLRYSAKALYVAATMVQPMDTLSAKFDQDDLAIFDDDSLEVFLFVPGKTEPHFIHLAVNANGNVYDARDGRSGYRVRGMRLKVRRLEDRWTLELKLPFEGIPIDRPFAGDFIGVRFCRNVAEPALVASLPALTANGHNRRADFAKLLFTAPSSAAADVAAEAEAYRQEVLRQRFYARYEAIKARLGALEGGVAGVDRKVPACDLAARGVGELREAVTAFETRNGADLAKRTLPPEAERKGLLAVAEGFRRFAADKAFLVWRTDPWAKAAPTDPPPAEGLGVTNLVFEQAGNEREVIGLCFQGLLCGPRLDLRIVPQEARRGRDKILCDAFEVHEEKFIRYDGQLLSDPLVRVDGNFITLTPGVSTRVWIVFNSRDVKPGEYRTRIELKPAWDADVPRTQIGVTAKVWNFSLPETRDWPLKSFFWGPNQEPNDEVETLRLMHSRHVTHGWTRAFLYWHGLGPDGRVLGKDPATFDRALAEGANDGFFRAAKALGMRFVLGWNTPTCWEWFATLAKRFRAMGFADEDFVFKALIADEFKKAQIPKYAREREIVAAHTTNLWFQAVYLSTPPPSGATMDDIEAAKLPEFYRMWTLIGDLAGDPKRGPEAIRRLRAKGCSVWDYHCGLHMHPRSSLDYYRNSPRLAYLRGLDGTAMWTSGRRRGADGFDASDGDDDGILWLGNGLRFTTSRNFEAYGQGLEDVAYVDLLKKELARREKGAFPQYERLVSDYAAQTKKPDQTQINAWRLAVGRAIHALRKGD